MKKKKIVCFGVLTSILLGGSTFVNTASAAETPKEQTTITNLSDFYKEGAQGAIEDIDIKINNMIKGIPKDLMFDNMRSSALGEDFKVSGINIIETNITNTKPIFLGDNLFINNTNQDQTYNSSIFSQAITQTTSTSTQLGFKTSATVKGKVGIPFIAEGEVSATLEFNFANTNTNTTSITNTITAPSQPVKVPTNKIYKTEVYFEQKSTSGQVEMYADTLTGVQIGGFSILFIGDALDKTKDTQGLIKSPNDPRQVRTKGIGHFTIEHGTNLIVKTYDVTSEQSYSDQNSGKLIDTKIIPLQ
ncbi:ETX/MTX2 family pore-forming toxin [Lysinibacillus fusiformis]|uniref:ETX/MTX2 family pore-forming toxin n=1 Tax=Lysinibacillus fusiformis TaxID=28031 RepID=UPI002EB89A3C|nr:ETX/MTX2 family pore-forming toxin [Lysinibacillus fusiformis]